MLIFSICGGAAITITITIYSIIRMIYEWDDEYVFKGGYPND